MLEIPDDHLAIEDSVQGRQAKDEMFEYWKKVELNLGLHKQQDRDDLALLLQCGSGSNIDVCLWNSRQGEINGTVSYDLVGYIRKDDKVRRSRWFFRGEKYFHEEVETRKRFFDLSMSTRSTAYDIAFSRRLADYINPRFITRPRDPVELTKRINELQEAYAKCLKELHRWS